MAESAKSSGRELEIALNPIGSLALRERLEKLENPAKLIGAFISLAPCAVPLTLSPNGFRIIECFLNANIDEVNVGLADSLSADWEGLENVLGTVKGRFVCETLLNRGLKAFAHKFVNIVPKDWWFKNETGLQSLHIVIKAIDISDIEVANAFCSYEQMEENLCDSAEGLYCVLKVKKRSMNQLQPGWKESLRELILRKATTIAGSEALVQVIVYGDFLVMGIVAMICARLESYEDPTTVSLIIRLIGLGSIDLKQFIFKFLCAPNANPLICRIRYTTRFDDFKQTCDSHFTPAQKNRLDKCLAADRIDSKVDECLKMLPSDGAPEEAMDTTTASEGHNKKRRNDQPITSPTHEAKKQREEVSEESPMVESPDETAKVSEIIMNDSRDEITQEATVTSASAISNRTIPGKNSTPPLIRFDPGANVVSMVMFGGKAREVLRELKYGRSDDYRSTIFECIQNELLALMMDERGFDVVKWFLVNGTFEQHGTIERSVRENVEDLVRSGAYGVGIVKTTIDECTNYKRKNELHGMLDRAMRYPPYSTLDEGRDWSDETEKNIDQKNTVAEYRVSLQESGRRSVSTANWIRPAELIPRAIPCSAQERFADVAALNQVLQRLKTDTAPNMEKLRSLADYAAGWKDDARKRVCIDTIIGSISSMSETESGMLLVRMLSNERSLRPLLIYPTASILHRLCGRQGKQVLVTMLSNQTCKLFIDSCLAGEESSSFVKMFHSDADQDECASIGMNLLARADDGDKARIRAFLSRYGRSIAETEKGRVFIGMVADPQPIGWNWKELLELLPPPSSLVNPPSTEVSASAEDHVNGREIKEESSTDQKISPVSSREDTVTAPSETTTSLSLHDQSNLNKANGAIPSLFSFTTTPLPLLDGTNLKNAKWGIPSLFSFAVPSQTTPSRGDKHNDNHLFSSRNDANNEPFQKKNPFQLARKVDHTSDCSLSQSPRFQQSSPYFRPLPSPAPLFKCPEIGVSPSGAPSFAIAPRPPPNPSLFSFKQPVQFEFKKSPLPLSFSQLVTEHIVMETVEFIVKSVVEANP